MDIKNNINGLQHIGIPVSDLEKMNYNLIDDQLQFIPFFEKGVKYF
jgi:hypothetical protein